MNQLLSYAIWYWMLFLAGVGAVTILLVALAIRDWYKCKRMQLESEKNEL